MREPDTERTYIAIDLKSFYASVECVDRNLDPLTTHLVVADASRTGKTICLAVSPSLKEYGIPGRARLFEVVQRVRDVNRERKRRIRQAPFSGASSSAPALAEDPTLQADFITAVPRMAFYIEWSTRIYEIYLRYIAPEDIHVYSIDEVLMDVTRYLSLYGKSARELAMEMIRAVLQETGITATAGIGTNLYLAKIAMDIEAKHTAPDADGVRIAELDEISYRKNLWSHRPITDFWRVGRGTARKLAPYGIYTMGDVARCSLENEDLLYDLFGVNAELLIDHAWGWEPCTIELIKAYRPQSRSLSAGQVLPCPYDMEKARIVVREMAETAALDLFEKRLLTDQLTLTVCYDIENLSRPEIRQKYRGPVSTDRYGRKTPKHAHGTVNLDRKTSSSGRIAEAVLSLYDRITDPALLIRRIYLNTNHVTEEGISGSQKQEKDPASAASFFTAASSAAASSAASAAAGRQERDPESMEPAEGVWEQMDLFTDYEAEERQKERDRAALEKERRLQEAMLSIRKKYGKNAILKGTNLQEGATLRQRNESIGGHRA